MWWMHDGWSWWAWMVMGLGIAMFWALVAWMIVRLVWGIGDRDRDAHVDDPDMILAKRLARGEIDDEEYHARRDALHAQGRHSTPSE